LLASSPSRRRRIASGSGFKEADINKLVADFQKMRSLMQQMGQGNFPGMPGMFRAWAIPQQLEIVHHSWLRGQAGAANKKKRKKEKKEKALARFKSTDGLNSIP